MALVTKQDSNFTGLTYAVETSAGVLPPVPIWTTLEPNSYKTYGGDVKTKARMPINQTRQLKKGVVVDLDATVGFQMDLTATNFQDLAQCFMFALLRTKGEQSVAQTTSPNIFNGPGALGGSAYDYLVGDLIFGKSFANTTTNGVHKVSAFPTIGVCATDTLTSSGVNVSNGDTVTIDGKVYTFQTVLTNVDGNVFIAGSAALSLANLTNAINGTGGVRGTDYATLMSTHPTVVATNPTATTVIASAKSPGTAGNLLAATKVAVTLTWGTATLLGGTNSALTTDSGVATSLVETGIISQVGYEYGAGEVTVDVSGVYPKLVVASVKGTSTLTTTANFAAAETVTIGGKIYTFDSTLQNLDGHVKVGASAQASCLNLANAINDIGGGVIGTDYAVNMTPNPYVTATSNATQVIVTAVAGGTVGNAIPTIKTAANATWGTATVTGGTGGRSFDSFGLIPGEFVFVGDDVTTKQFFHAADNGFCRVRTISATNLVFDKTQSVMVTDDGTVNGAGGAGQNLRLYFGRVLKNENTAAAIVKRTVQFERSMGYVDDTLTTQIQGEYVLAGLADGLKIDIKTAEIIKLELDFLGTVNVLNTSVTGLKSGTRPSLLDSQAFNTTSDVAYTKMMVVNPTNASPLPLFAYFTDLSIDVKNNVKMNKAVSVLGAFSSTAGFFQVSAAVTAYFTDVAGIQAVKNNSSVTLETHMVKFLANTGISIDMPLLVMSKAMADVKLNEPITIPLSGDAATGKLIDPNLDYTMLLVFWDYLPLFA